jgi:hypothetical protein
MIKFQKIVMTGAIATSMLSGLTLTLVSFMYPLFSVNAQSTRVPAKQSTTAPTKQSTIVPGNTATKPGKPFSSLNFSDTGRPRRRVGGAARGECTVAGKPPLTALLPDISAGLTLSESPSFWVYLPNTLKEGGFAEFVLKDSQDKSIYTTKLSRKEASPGIIRLDLPSSVSLKTNSNYYWYFVTYCNPKKLNTFDYVNGLVRRVERPQLEKQLQVIPAQEHSRLYITEEIWYDALTSLGARLRTSPRNEKLNQSWTSLLRTVGLENVASEPFAP